MPTLPTESDVDPCLPAYSAYLLALTREGVGRRSDCPAFVIARQLALVTN